MWYSAVIVPASCAKDSSWPTYWDLGSKRAKKYSHMRYQYAACDRIEDHQAEASASLHHVTDGFTCGVVRIRPNVQWRLG